MSFQTRKTFVSSSELKLIKHATDTFKGPETQ